MAIITLASREFNQGHQPCQESGLKGALKGPVFITDQGKPAHVLLSIEDYRRITAGHRKIADALAMPGLAGIKFDPPRVCIGIRPADFLDVYARHQCRVRATQDPLREGRPPCRAVGPTARRATNSTAIRHGRTRLRVRVTADRRSLDVLTTDRSGRVAVCHGRAPDASRKPQPGAVIWPAHCGR